MGFFLPLLGAGLSIAKGISSHSAAKASARQARSREVEKQTLALKQFVVEQEAREAELNMQLSQLRNQQIESQEIADSQKGDIAMAAEAAQSRALAAQTSSGLAAGGGTFGSVLRDIGFAEEREISKIDKTEEFRNAQIATERKSSQLRAKVPEPHLSTIQDVDTTGLAIGTGLSIASSLAGIASEHAPVGGFTPFSSRSSRDRALSIKHGI